jgi:hypothetical protein
MSQQVQAGATDCWWHCSHSWDRGSVCSNVKSWNFFFSLKRAAYHYIEKKNKGSNTHHILITIVCARKKTANTAHTPLTLWKNCHQRRNALCSAQTLTTASGQASGNAIKYADVSIISKLPMLFPQVLEFKCYFSHLGLYY